jgi:(2Fe-2S) ferredoxin
MFDYGFAWNCAIIVATKIKVNSDSVSTMSFYSHHIFFCTNERDDGRPSCGHRCSGELRDYTKKKIKSLGLNGHGRVRVNNAGCLDRCDDGPVVVVYPEEIWYRVQSEADVDAIIAEHVQGGTVVERLRI